MSKTQQIRWTPDECSQVAAEVERMFPGAPFAAKAVKLAQTCLPADRRKTGIGPNDIKRIRELIPGAKSPRPGRGAGKSLAKVSRRAAAEPVFFQPVTDALSTSNSLSDSLAQQLAGAVIDVGIQALEKAASRLRSLPA
jgi:hypothetical protein